MPSALAQWQAALQVLLAEGYSSLDALEALARQQPDLLRAAKADVARTALRKGLIDRLDQPMTYRIRKQATAAALAEGEGLVPHRPTETPRRGETSMTAGEELVQMARGLVAVGKAATLDKA